LYKSRLVNIDALTTLIGKPESLAKGQQIADDAITLVRDNGKLLPLVKQAGTVKPALPYQRVDEARNGLVAIIFSDDVRMDSGHTMERQLRSQVPDVNVMYVDPRIAAPVTDLVMAAVEQAKAVVAAVYVVPTAGKALKGAAGLTNSVALSDATGTLLQKVLDHAAEKTVVVAMGNPYIAENFPAIQNYVCAFSNATVSETSAVKALFGEIPIRGHLPVTIPNIAQRGAGIERAPQIAQGESIHAH
jgi:beta-N-acetylhexosaminidase